MLSSPPGSLCGRAQRSFVLSLMDQMPGQSYPLCSMYIWSLLCGFMFVLYTRSCIILDGGALSVLVALQYLLMSTTQVDADVEKDISAFIL